MITRIERRHKNSVVVTEYKYMIKEETKVTWIKGGTSGRTVKVKPRNKKAEQSQNNNRTRGPKGGTEGNRGEQRELSGIL